MVRFAASLLGTFAGLSLAGALALWAFAMHLWLDGLLFCAVWLVCWRSAVQFLAGDVRVRVTSVWAAAGVAGVGVRIMAIMDGQPLAVALGLACQVLATVTLYVPRSQLREYFRAGGAMIEDVF